MNCPLQQVEFCFQVTSTCQSHLGLSLEADFEDYASIDAVILEVQILFGNSEFSASVQYSNASHSLQSITYQPIHMFILFY